MQASTTDFSQHDRSVIFDLLDMSLNITILEALLHGLYTGIVAVTLWIVFCSPKPLRSNFLRGIIFMLYVLRTISFAMTWALERCAFIDHGGNNYSMFTALDEHGAWGRASYLVDGITGGISTLLVDITIIWRCLILWDRQWRVAFIPIICTAAATVMKAMQISSDLHTSTNDISAQFTVDINWSLSYILLIPTTTLICTLLIIYRIVRKARGMSTSRKIIVMLIESSAMYTLSHIVYLALVSRNLDSAYYADTIAAYVKAIAPTLLVGRVSAHANASSRRQKMVAMWENHPPLVGCFRGEVNNNSHSLDDEHQTVSESSMGKETV